MVKDQTSAFACPACFSAVSKEQEAELLDGGETDALNYVECKPCGEFFNADEAEVQLQSETVPLLEIPTVYDTEWFHISNSASWIEDITQDEGCIPFIHAGNKQSALDRYDGAYKGKTAYLYKFKISSIASIGSVVYEDHNDWPYEVDYPLTLTDDVTGDAIDGFRYVNRWEAPGFISLLLDPRLIVDVIMEEYSGEPVAVSA